MSGLIRHKIELDRAFMPVLVTSNFDDDSIKNEHARMETAFSHYKSGRNSFKAKILCMSSLSASIIRPIARQESSPAIALFHYEAF